MVLKNKNILIIGLARTGVATINQLSKLGANIIVNDLKKQEDLKEILNELSSLENVTYILGEHITDISNIDLAIISPGVPTDLTFVKMLKEKYIEVIGEIELAYRLAPKNNYIGITGTNGKTTTTSLLCSILKASNFDTHITGNIGNPLINTIDTATKESKIVTELSSFQLESIQSYKPKISIILNITPDHLNRHKTMENYINAKAQIFKNQDEHNYTILNYDDEVVRQLGEHCKSKVLYYSTKEKICPGIYIEEDTIIIEIDKKIALINKKDLSLPGEHNLENSMAAAIASYLIGTDPEIIANVLKTFAPVEHRQEYVQTINNIKFINDSKGTNPDSTIKALNSYDEKIVLIAGGYDKGSNFSELLDIAKDKVSSLVLIGQNSDILLSEAERRSIQNIHLACDMEHAVKTAFNNAKEGQIVLLSPACASWDMYANFEERGNDFKAKVMELNSTIKNNEANVNCSK